MGKLHVGTILPDNGTYGAWLTETNEEKKGDVHVYVSQQFGVVIGQNKDHHDKIHFSDFALSIAEKGCTLQYADEQGNVKNVDVPDPMVKAHLLAMLVSLKTMLVV